MSIGPRVIDERGSINDIDSVQMLRHWAGGVSLAAGNFQDFLNQVAHGFL